MSSEPVAGKTSVIVVTADSGEVAFSCVRKVLQSAVPIELIVVDNASSDDFPARIEEEFPQDARLRVIRNRRNVGFGTACNQAARIASGDILMFLNPDCLVEASTIATLREIAASQPAAGVLGVHVTDSRGRGERANRRRDPMLWRALMSASGLSRFQHRIPGLGGVEDPSSRSDTKFEPVDAVSGACMMVPKRVFTAIGGFDEGYFLHCEDLDLCRRVRDTGCDVLYVPCIRVMHAQGSSSRSRPVFVGFHKHRSMWRYFRKFDPAARNPLLLSMVLFGIWAHFACMLPVYAWRRLRHAVSSADQRAQGSSSP